MATRKTYQALAFIVFDTYVNANGQKVLIQFRGGSLKPRINGKYSTSDPAIIKALDSAGGLGKDFKCIEVEELQDAEPKGKAKPVPPTPPADNEEEDLQEEEAADVVKVPGITTVQAAKDYLLKQFPDEVKASHVTNGAKVKEVAAAKKIMFVDLP